MKKNLYLCSNEKSLFNTCFFVIDENPKKVSKKLCQEILNKILKIKKENIIIEKNFYGKPFVKNASNLDFNISHTKGAAVLFFSKVSVGIDIEKFRKINFKIADRFFNKKEKEFFYNSDNKKESFFKIWTRKEAYVKYLGVGFSGFSADTFEIKEKIKTFRNKDFIISICAKNFSSDFLIKTIKIDKKHMFKNKERNNICVLNDKSYFKEIF